MPMLTVHLTVFVAIALVILFLVALWSRRRGKSAVEREDIIVAAALSTPACVDNAKTPAAEPVIADKDQVTETAVETKVAEEAPETDAEKPVEETELPSGSEEKIEEAPVKIEPRPAGLDGPRNGKADDLTAIKGIGQAIQSMLHENGIFHYSQIADWSSDEAIWVERKIGFSGRVTREKWVEQAKKLAAAPAKAAKKKSATKTRKPASKNGKRTRSKKPTT
ncbi:endonuclease [Falsochrobactrum ovis]|uniref:Putative flap endonuclease-1-like 5' DNA nuclease n=1 Tax=Falsochrobactrum ovis TaxID=1293442 RepID=A0A364JV13_9HYPH|nr:endonuclease [Falsochrobactrum ovis]RAK28956.1 putative flap endonuclease-1-like 5' DNA nuclease [Falsochrobactrum ovis]